MKSSEKTSTIFRKLVFTAKEKTATFIKTIKLFFIRSVAHSIFKSKSKIKDTPLESYIKHLDTSYLLMRDILVEHKQVDKSAINTFLAILLKIDLLTQSDSIDFVKTHYESKVDRHK